MFRDRAMNNRKELFGGRKESSTSKTRYDVEEARHLLESQNDAHIANLEEKVAVLKNLSQSIHSEVKEHNSFLEGMGDDMLKSDNLLGATMRRLGKLMDTGGQRYMCYLILFVLFVFFLLWYLLKRSW